MVFLHLELLVLLAASFMVGAAASTILVRLLVRRTAAQASAYVAEPGGRR